MKTLIYVPIIHTSADLGSLAKEVTKRGIADLGEDFWEKHRKTVEVFWNTISNYFDSMMDVTGMKIYQDGMVAEAGMGQEIVTEIAKLGSKNYEIISKLLKKGATLVKTEDFNLVKEERDKLLKITQAKGIVNKIIGFAKYKLTKNRLLNKRDKFIAKKIDETLARGDRGVLFIGASHNIKKRLPKNILIREIKNFQKVREYQKLLPFYNRDKERFKELSNYLTLPID